MRSEEGERIADVSREVVACADRVGVDAGVFVVSQGQARECGGIAANRRIRLGGAGVERPARIAPSAVPVAGDETRLDRSDRASPASGRRFLEALSVALGGPREARFGFFSTSVHQQR